MLSDPPPDLLHSVKSEQFLPPISLWTNLGGLFLVMTVGTAFIMAVFIKYNVTVKARGIIRPSGEIRIVQAATEGTVTKIEVKENQVVKQGDTITTLEDSQLQTKKSQLQGNIQQNQLQFAQIDAQLKALQTQMAAESSLMKRAIASAQADLSRNQRDYSDRQLTTQTEVQEAAAALELAREEQKRYQKLGNTGAISQLQIKEKEQAFKVATARFQRTKIGLNPSAATVGIAQERIAQERAKGESTLARVNKERDETIRRQVEIKNQISSAQRELKQISTELQKTIIRTSEAGTILRLELRNPGQVVRLGEAIAQIAPTYAPLVVKARVAAQDIGKVQICKAEKVSNCKEGRVLLQISAYPFPDYGTLKGAVRAITPDAITSQNNSVDLFDTPRASASAPYYEVTIQPERLYLVRSDRQYPIQSGMVTTASILYKEETLLTFILRKVRLLTDL